MKEFNLIYNENYKWVLNLIKSKTNHSHDSEEITNDVFMSIYEKLDTFDATKCKSGLVGWIRAITWNRIIDYYRKKKLKMQSIEAFMDEDGKEIFSIKDGVDIEADYCTKELFEMGKDVINLLPNPYKKVATLFYIKDCTYDEIATITGLGLPAIKVQLNRARTKIQSEFGVAE